MSVEHGFAVKRVRVTHTQRLSGRMPRPAGCRIQRSSLHFRQVRRLRWLMSPPMTWARRRTPSGRPAHASRPTVRSKLGPRSGRGSGRASLLLSVNSFLTISNAEAPFAGTSSTTDLKGHQGRPGPVALAVARAIDRAVDGPLLSNRRGGRMDRHATTRRLRHLAHQAGCGYRGCTRTCCGTPSSPPCATTGPARTWTGTQLLPRRLHGLRT